ncbi:unnamed protein product, partial [Musa textilis]
PSRAVLWAVLLLSWRSRLSAKVGAALRRKGKASSDRQLGVSVLSSDLGENLDSCWGDLIPFPLLEVSFRFAVEIF